MRTAIFISALYIRWAIISSAGHDPHFQSGLSALVSVGLLIGFFVWDVIAERKQQP